MNLYGLFDDAIGSYLWKVKSPDLIDYNLSS